MSSQTPVRYTVEVTPRDSGAFVIRYIVNVLEISAGKERSWSVLRRYTDFKTLCADLQNFEIVLPPMPKKSFFRKTASSSFREQRVEQLNFILHAIILSDPQLRGTVANHFLCDGRCFNQPSTQQEPLGKENAAIAKQDSMDGLRLPNQILYDGRAADHAATFPRAESGMVSKQPLSKCEDGRQDLQRDSDLVSGRLSDSTQLPRSLGPSLEFDDASLTSVANAVPTSPLHLCESDSSSPCKPLTLNGHAYGAVGSDCCTPPQRAASLDRPEVGDLVSLIGSVLPEFVGHKAVVTKAFENHCAVCVLDNSCSYGVGEYWPNLENIAIVSRTWRLGMQVTLVALRGPKTRHLNGLSGVVVEHPRSGHPSFICKDAFPDRPTLTLCVRLDKPEISGQRTVLVEPKFMQPRADEFSHAVENLRRIVDEH